MLGSMQSMVVVTGLVAVLAQAASDSDKFDSRGIHDYAFQGCGSSSLLETDYRKVVSLNRDSIFPAICGSICHELYVATVRGECYCTESINESIDTDSSECPEGVPTIYKDQKFEETPKKLDKDPSTNKNTISLPKLSGIHTDGDLDDDESEHEHEHHDLEHEHHDPELEHENEHHESEHLKHPETKQKHPEMELEKPKYKHPKPVYHETGDGEEVIEICQMCQKTNPNRISDHSHKGHSENRLPEQPPAKGPVNYHEAEEITKLETKIESFPVSTFATQHPAPSAQPAPSAGNATVLDHHQATQVALGSRTIESVSIAVIIFGWTFFI